MKAERIMVRVSHSLVIDFTGVSQYNSRLRKIFVQGLSLSGSSRRLNYHLKVSCMCHFSRECNSVNDIPLTSIHVIIGLYLAKIISSDFHRMPISCFQWINSIGMEDGIDGSPGALSYEWHKHSFHVNRVKWNVPLSRMTPWNSRSTSNSDILHFIVE